MCGINGVVSKANIDCASIVSVMNQAIVHRGPDDHGLYYNSRQSYNICLGMTRLSIIDVSNGSQPMESSCGNYILTFNGEIYNYRHLRSLCCNQGYSFKTRSDTEVVLALYQLYGKRCFSMLDGMFALSILNKERNKIIFARDFFGEKPLHFFRHKDSTIYWASEIKSIIKSVKDIAFTIDKDAVAEYFCFQYVPSPKTVYKEISKMPRNSTLEIDLGTLKETKEIIHEIQTTASEKKSYKQVVQEIEKLVVDSILSRTNSDVGFSSFLSGGVDSGVIAAVLAENYDLQTYTVKVGTGRFDESGRAAFLSKKLGFKNSIIELSSEMDSSMLNNAIDASDEPFADSSLVSSFSLFKRVSKTGHKVFLSGDGGDELFAGYLKHLHLVIEVVYKRIIPKSVHNIIVKRIGDLGSFDKQGFFYKVRKVVQSVDYAGKGYSKILMNGFKDNELKEFLEFDFRPIELPSVRSIKEAMLMDIEVSLDGGLLPKVDRLSMANSIEVRSPFLNVNILKYVFSLPENYIHNGLRLKRLLKDAFKSHVPKNYFRAKKRGFGSPIDSLLMSPDVIGELEAFTNEKFLIEQGLFKVNYVKQIMNDFIEGDMSQNHKVWTLYCFQKWYVKNSTNFS